MDLNHKRICHRTSFTLFLGGMVVLGLLVQCNMGDRITIENQSGAPNTALGAADLKYSTFLGGNAYDLGTVITLDAEGCIYIAGMTQSDNFPTTPGANDSTHAGVSYDIFVSKLSADGHTLIYSTLIGGTGTDTPTGIVVDAAGCAYLVGHTDDFNYDFPTTDGAINETSNGLYDVFVCKLSADAHTLEYSTVLGGDGYDFGSGIAVDAAGCAYITGSTGLQTSKSFPTTAGAYDTNINDYDAFLCKISDDGKTLLYSTFLGGNGADSGCGIALDGVGNVYISGFTGAGFPTTTGAYDTSYNGGSYDAFLCKMSADGSAMLNSTLIGGSSDDKCRFMTVDSAGCLYLTGTTTNTTANFPTTPGAYDPSNNGGTNDIFVCKLNADGSSLLYSTFIGGDRRDDPSGIAVDAAGCAHIQGTIYTSAGVPTTSDAINTTAPGGTCDAYVFKLSADGSSLLYATYLGCTGEDNGYAITLDAANYVYITGGTANSTVFFPTTPDALNETHNGDIDDWDMYYSKLDLGLTTPSFITGSQTIKEKSITVQWNAAAGATRYNIYVNGVLNETTDAPATSQNIILNGKGVYSLTVTAVRNGHESPRSVAIIITADIAEDQNWTMIIVIAAAAIVIGGFVGVKLLKKRKNSRDIGMKS